MSNAAALSLKELVGLQVSSLKNKLLIPKRFPNFLDARKGVPPSPKVTIKSLSICGKVI